MEKYIVDRVNAIMQTDDSKIVKRLEGGMSNYTYVVESKGRKYTYRVPGQSAEKFVDRDVELANIKLVDSLGVNNETTYFDVESGEKMAVYVEGTILSETGVSEYDAKSVEALKKVHNSSLVFKDYDPFGRLDQYEQYCKDAGLELPAEYYALRHKLDREYVRFKDVKKVPCHCDYQPTNLVMGEDRLYILDWEFAGMNDPFYDIACYGNAGFDKALSLLKAYVGREPSVDEYRRLYFYRAFQCLQWYNVAMFKDSIGLSKDLNMDFVQVANMFYGFAEDLLAKYDELK